MSRSVRNILITGATRGLGLYYAKHLAEKGYNLALTDISEKACGVYGELNNVDSLLNELSKHDIKACFYKADLVKQGESDDLIKKVLADFGIIEGVITNAGGDIAGSDQDASGGKALNNSFFISYDEQENIFRRNYHTCLHVLRSIVPSMVENGYGKIITVSSVNAGFGVSKETTYAVAKSAVVHLTRSLASELRSKGINVNCLMPGPCQTGRFMSTLKDRNPHDLEFLKEKSRLERVARPEDLAPVVEFLFSKSSDFISGEVIRVDGGLFNQPV